MLRKIAKFFGGKSHLSRILSNHFKDECENTLLGIGNFKALNWLVNTWYDFWIWWVVRFETAERMLWWGWKMRKSHDWDNGYLFEVMYLKMKRMEHSFTKYGSCVWNQTTSKELIRFRRALELIKQLHEDTFDQPYDLHEAKWGKLNMDMENGSSIIFSRSKAITKDERKQERAEFSIVMDKSNQLRLDAMQEFCVLFQKDAWGWWD